MKKIVITNAILFGIVFGASAQYFDNGNQRQGGGLFGYGDVSDEYFYGGGNVNGNPLLPGLPSHNGENQDAPIGGGSLLLIGFGAAYAMTKKNKR